MIRPVSNLATDNAPASIGSMIPRVLVHSEVTPSGDTIEILRPRHTDRLITRFFAPSMSRSRRYERFPLDSRGSRIWCLIDSRRSVADVVAEYRKYYPDDHHQVEQRVQRYLEILADHGFIEIVTA